MELTTFWFILIAALWSGYFFLEGFDVGVGMLLHPLGRNESERRGINAAVGRSWDGNEIWLVAASAATIAVFPYWSAMSSPTFQVPMALVLLSVLVRLVAFNRRFSTSKAGWDVAIAITSWIPAVLWGVMIAHVLQGPPVDEGGIFAGGVVGLLDPFGLLGGVTSAALFLLHGAQFLSVQCRGDVGERARRAVLIAGPITAVSGATFLIWNQVARGVGWTWVPTLAAITALLVGLVAAHRQRGDIAFGVTAAAIILAGAALAGALFAEVIAVANSAADNYIVWLTSMIGLALAPGLVLYQIWTVSVFRQRTATTQVPQANAEPQLLPVPPARLAVDPAEANWVATRERRQRPSSSSCGRRPYAHLH